GRGTEELMEENDRTEQEPVPSEPGGEEEQARAREQALTEREREPAAEDRAPAQREREPGAGADLPPGAELEPIAIEPERELGAEERARLEAEAEERARLEAEATAERVPEPAIRPQPRVGLDSDRQIQ